MTAVINITMNKNKKTSNFQALDHKHITRWKKKKQNYLLTTIENLGQVYLIHNTIRERENGIM